MQTLAQAGTVGILDVDFDEAVEPSGLQALRLNGVEVAVRLHLHEGIESGIIKRQLLKFGGERGA
jgi:hypothetical protein